MTVCDFSRSYVTFVTEGRSNNARIQVEALCDLTSDGDRVRYLLVASCKAEDTYGTADLFRLPNYDFSCIFSNTEYQIIRVHLPVREDWLETGLNAGRFQEVNIHVAETPARLCQDEGAIVRGTLDSLPVVARTELLDEAGKVYARLEYPVKTMNVNDQDWSFQVDTGPLIVPDRAREVAQEIERFDVAFVVYNRFDSAEFIVLEPTPAREGGVLVGHYSRVRKAAARNQLFCVGGAG